MQVSHQNLSTKTGLSPKTLIIEDSSIYQNLLNHYLSSNQIYDVSIASQGEDAIIRFEQALNSNKHFDLVFLDYFLPDQTGDTIIQELRKKEKHYQASKHAHIIVATVCSDTLKLMEMISLGADDFIIKPINQIHFDKLIDSYSKSPQAS